MIHLGASCSRWCTKHHKVPLDAPIIAQNLKFGVEMMKKKRKHSNLKFQIKLSSWVILSRYNGLFSKKNWALLYSRANGLRNRIFPSCNIRSLSFQSYCFSMNFLNVFSASTFVFLLRYIITVYRDKTRITDFAPKGDC